MLETIQSKIKNLLYLSQPNGYTCQAACIGMATGDADVMGIRSKLEAIGTAGDPAVMGRLLKDRLGSKYSFDDNACLSEMRDWLKDGEFLIVHSYLTASGHVISLDGVQIDSTNLSYKFDVRDPWSEFDFKAWAYNKPQIQKYTGYYSSYGIYAACVAGQSASDAARIYRKGELDSQRKGAWVHRVRG